VEYNKKGKVPVTGVRNSFTGIVLQKSGIYTYKIDKLQVVLRVLPQKEKTLQRQNRNIPAL